MHELGISDDVPRSMIFYEEQAPGAVKRKVDGHLYKPSLQRITAAAPKVVSDSVRSRGRGQDDAQDLPDTNTTSTQDLPAPIRAHTNHAGFYVDNLPAQPAEQEQWRATLEEVCGFTWKQDDQLGADPPLLYEVTAIRRWNGRLWAVVKTSNGDMQHDHLLSDVRRRMFAERVEKVHRSQGFAGPLPLMLSWEAFFESTLAMDVDLVATNLGYYRRRMPLFQPALRFVVIVIVVGGGARWR
jgi:hypothetical protein